MSLEKFEKRATLVGPWGGQSGYYWDDGVHSTIRQLEIGHGTGVDSIRIEYDSTGRSVWSERHGGSGGTKTDKVRLEYPDEFLISVHGYYGSLQEGGHVIIRSLTFESNKRKYGPFGVEKGTYFTSSTTHGKIVGFVGKAGWYLDAIGFYIEPLYKPVESHALYHSQQFVAANGTEKYEYSMIQGSLGTNYDLVIAVRQKDNLKPSPPIDHRKPTIQDHPKPTIQDLSHTEPKKEAVPRLVVKDPAPYGPGPWGGEGGKPWDDGVFTGIKQIILTKTDAICCIEIEYDRNGQSIWSVKHGSSSGQTADRVKLDYPHEVLTCVSGYYGPIKKEQGTKVIQSLTFHTSRRKYGPFGQELGTYFASGTTEGKVVGFHGRSSMYLDAIGVHMQHWLGNQKPSKPPSLMKIFS
ncbi:UNVERIFIED_CONTAM: Jacalin-related lectin 3 [Sesamum radiatum]|uniref:Jacalin-related lectin 3 n=1 Tax=Sesamum radiatum TaxID=300843 RepID=A0AAW2SIK2_SESRA